MNICFFCGPTGEIITEEHIWPQWVSRLLIGKYGTNHFINIRSEGDTTKAYRRSIVIDHTSTTVCEPCNSRWLSAFENDEVLPIASDLIIEDKTVALSPFDQSTLAAWAYKMALLLEVPDKATPKPFSTAGERLLFRQTKLAHPFCKVCLARYNFGQHLGHALTPVHTFAEQSAPHNNFKLAVSTITAGHLALQVVAVRSVETGSLIPTSEVGLCSGDDLPAGVIQIWPADIRPLQWPPSHTLELPELEQWTNDWENPWQGKAARLRTERHGEDMRFLRRARRE